LPPTMLMGATLPAVARLVERTPTGVSWLGFFYGGNVAGAVLRSPLAGLFLFRGDDIAAATYLAAATNAAAAAVAWVFSTRISSRTSDAEPSHGRATKSRQAASRSPAETRGAKPHGSRVSVYFAIGLSGLAALGAEVIWTRILSLL